MLKYTYASDLLRYCTLKAGNVLEVKTLLEGRRIMENGVPLFGDSRMGVSIDWDGVVHNPMKRLPETRNEIDVVLMQGTKALLWLSTLVSIKKIALPPSLREVPRRGVCARRRHAASNRRRRLLASRRGSVVGWLRHRKDTPPVTADAVPHSL